MLRCPFTPVCKLTCNLQVELEQVRYLQSTCYSITTFIAFDDAICLNLVYSILRHGTPLLYQARHQPTEKTLVMTFYLIGFMAYLH